MEDGEVILNTEGGTAEPMDTSDFSLGEVEKFDDVEYVSQLEEKLRLHIPVLERMLFQEYDSKELERIRKVLNAIPRVESGSLGGLTKKLSYIYCDKYLDKWIRDMPPTPPLVKNVKFEKKNGRLVATWSAPEWPLPISYCGKCAQASGDKEIVEKFEDITEKSYELSNVLPTQYYVVTVWAINSKGQKGEEKCSKRDILCKRSGDVFIDDTSPLRTGYHVYKGYLKTAATDLDSVAVKIVDAENLREVNALQKLEHKNVVTYRASGNISESRSFGKQIFIAMELCCTDTFTELVGGGELNMHCCKISLLHMMLGIAAIHEAGFLHRDLNPQNILRSLNGKDMKVADFGLCKEMDSNKSKVSKSAHEIGTEGWGSPEHYEPNAKMSQKSDIYSAGLVSSFGLSHGQHVYGSKVYNWKPSIIEGSEVNLSILACDNSEIAKDMISKMLQREPDKRPSAKQVLAHPFYWDDEKKLDFLHHMSSVFTPVFLKKIYPDPEQLTTIVMIDLDAKKSIFQTKNGEANWVKKMEETPVVTTSYQHVLLTAKCEVYPYTRYDPASVFDLIRFIRNVEEHYRENREFNDSKSNVWKLFYECFPTLICSVYNAVYKHLPQIGNCSDFPNEATRFFTETAHYQPLPIS